MKVAVLGAGAAGLAAALQLRAGGAEVLVFEAAERVGGKIHSHAEAGFFCEDGPNSLLAQSPTALDLARTEGLALTTARPPSTRLVFRAGKLRPAPSLGLVSPVGWLRALAEPLTALRPRAGDLEESLRDFLERHLGSELGELGGRLMASGVYGGDPALLSAEAAFPKLASLSGAGQSLFLGALRRQRQARRLAPPAGAPRTLWSLERGLSALPAALAARLGGAVRLSTPVEGIDRVGARLALRLGGAEAGSLAVDGVLCALPVRAAARLLSPLASGFEALAEVRVAPLAVVHLGYRSQTMARVPAGFGVLDGDGSLGFLGALFPSSLFARRAPEGQVLLTCMVGGMLEPRALDETDAALVARCHAELRVLFGIAGRPTFQRVHRWAEAVPQLDLGHAARVAAARAAAATLPPLELAGAAVDGVSVEAVLAGGQSAARRLLGRLPALTHRPAPLESRSGRGRALEGPQV